MEERKPQERFNVEEKKTNLPLYRVKRGP